MQSEMADFARVPPPGKLEETYASLILAVSIHYAFVCKPMTLSTEPEIHNLLHCSQRRTEPRPQVTCTEN